MLFNPVLYPHILKSGNLGLCMTQNLAFAGPLKSISFEAEKEPSNRGLCQSTTALNTASIVIVIRTVQGAWETVPGSFRYLLVKIVPETTYNVSSGTLNLYTTTTYLPNDETVTFLLWLMFLWVIDMSTLSSCGYVRLMTRCNSLHSELGSLELEQSATPRHVYTVTACFPPTLQTQFSLFLFQRGANSEIE